MLKFQLDKSSKKFNCPNCSKKTFVKFIDVETKEYYSEEFGRCDREQNCGYFRKPESNEVVVVDKAEANKKQTSYIQLEVLESFYLNKKQDNFSKFLSTIFTAEQLAKAYSDYFISDYGNGNTIFWQIDQLERVRSGKIMAYNPTTGKRVKDANGKAHINWIHSAMKIPEFNLKQCIFGLHLTKEIRTKTIALVESEKTAVLMSVFEPDFLWLATGSKSGFKLEYLAPLKLRKIIGFPDKGCYHEWNATAIKLTEQGFNLTINDFLENSDCELGEDIADNYLRL